MVLARELGRKSAFARKHGFYMDVVTPDIACLPGGWEKRLKPFRVSGITASCLDMHDLLASKLSAGRLNDLELAGAVLKLRLARFQACELGLPKSFRLQLASTLARP
jgi:hypothetical protein